MAPQFETSFRMGEKVQTTDGQTAYVGAYHRDIDAFTIWYADGEDELVGPKFLHKLEDAA